MSAFMRWLRRVFGGDGTQVQMTPAKRAGAAVLLIATLALAVFALVQPAPVQGTPGVSSQATAHVLRELAAELQRADAAGDAAMAVLLMPDTTRLLQTINDGAALAGEAMRMCQLAAKHLAGGVVAVSEGGRWGERGRFEAALKRCG